MEITMDSLLEIARDVGASDVHITVGLKAYDREV